MIWPVVVKGPTAVTTKLYARLTGAKMATTNRKPRSNSVPRPVYSRGSPWMAVFPQKYRRMAVLAQNR